MIDTIRGILEQYGKLSGPAANLKPDANLYDAGLTSFASVQLMLALEEAFDIEFPDEALNRRTFSSMTTIADTIATLQTANA
ncbi:MAG: acyl carrier protein [Beijerinckiaceae bacterium]